MVALPLLLMELERLPRRLARFLRRAAVVMVRVGLALFAKNLLSRRQTARLVILCAGLTRRANRVSRRGRNRHQR